MSVPMLKLDRFYELLISIVSRSPFLTAPAVAITVFPRDPVQNITLSDPSFSLGIPGYGPDGSAFTAPILPQGTFVVDFMATKPVFLEGGFMVMPGF